MFWIKTKVCEVFIVDGILVEGVVADHVGWKDLSSNQVSNDIWALLANHENVKGPFSGYRTGVWFDWCDDLIDDFHLFGAATPATPPPPLHSSALELESRRGPLLCDWGEETVGWQHVQVWRLWPGQFSRDWGDTVTSYLHFYRLTFTIVHPQI